MIGLIVSNVEKYIFLIKNIDFECCVFYIDFSQYHKNINLPIFPINEIFGFKGTLISTDLQTTNIMRKTNNKKIFYVQDLEWTKNTDYFENRLDTLTNPAITYIASGEDVQRGLAAWGTQAPIIRPVEFNKILNV